MMINRGGVPGQGVDRAGGVARAGWYDDPPEPGLDIYYSRYSPLQVKLSLLGLFGRPESLPTGSWFKLKKM